jgi:hypothetical protein
MVPAALPAAAEIAIGAGNCTLAEADCIGVQKLNSNVARVPTTVTLVILLALPNRDLDMWGEYVFTHA